jgi:ribosomal protein L30E
MVGNSISEIQKAILDKKLIVGTERVMKKIKEGTLKKVFITKNAPEMIKNDITHYTAMGKTEVINLEQTSEDMKEVCKKPFNISIVGI